MSVSVVLCTYNGEKFLDEQLVSLANQTRIPDELIVCDDHSTDSTIRIIKSFQQSSPFDVHLYTNETRMGSTKNYEQAISLSKGTIIFLSDQDDLWHPEKIKTILDTFSSHHQCGCVFSNAELVDENAQYTGGNLWDSIGFDRKKRREFMTGHAIPVLLKQHVITGATMAFEGKCKNIVLPIPQGWIHDAWISLLIAYTSRVCMVERPLIQYRQHSFQQIGINIPSLSDRVKHARDNDHLYRREAEKYRLLYHRVLELQDQGGEPVPVALLREKIDHLEERSHISSHGMSRITVPVQELIKGRYHRYSCGWLSFFKDLLIGQ